MNEEYFLTIKEFAVIAKMSPKTVYRLCRSRKLRSVRIGGSIRIPSSVVDELQGREETV